MEVTLAGQRLVQLLIKIHGQCVVDGTIKINHGNCQQSHRDSLMAAVELDKGLVGLTKTLHIPNSPGGQSFPLPNEFFAASSDPRN